jgi:hypothetical protein
MRLISKQDADKLAKDPKAEVTTFYVEKCKGNTIPKHFMAEDNKDKKMLNINGQDVTVARNKERSEYCAFCTGTGDTQQCFYVRNHAFLDHSKTYVTYVRPEKPKPEPKAKKTPEEKAAAKAAKSGDKGTATAGKTKSSAASEKAAREAAAGAGDTGAA